MSYDNVIIFGAGASWDAGIPLLNDFVDTMWIFGIRGRSRHGPLSLQDKELLNQANQIRLDLERYNTRANFNTRNLEDVLSLLSFESMAGGQALERYHVWIKAITRTIELSTVHPSNGVLGLREKKSVYHAFWHAILGSDLSQNPPALITFNYDLTLERTLNDYFFFIHNDHFKPVKSSCKISYFCRPYDFILTTKPQHYDLPVEGTGWPPRRHVVRHDGAQPFVQYNCDSDVEIPYLKLHGSLNWCSQIAASPDKPKDLIPPGIFTEVVQTPLILPPVFNKMNSVSINPVWQRALEILREAKHIIIVGYSLPKTDTYMQYFLKAAVGPNSNLQYVIVFDPILYQDASSAEEMKSRYKECFSPQFNERIVFDLDLGFAPEGQRGTFASFVKSLAADPKRFFFSP